jgi:hypothetical protein
MNVEKELVAHHKALSRLNKKFYSRFKAAYDDAIERKARNYRALDKIAADNVLLDAKMKELNTAMAITDLENN